MSSSAESHGLLSPAASATSQSASPHSGRGLPQTRSHPLRPGGHKEIALINYVDDKILRITRRYGKKFSESQALKDDAPGYTSFEQVVADIDAAFEVVWISGTPAIQIPYLLSLAGIFCSYMPAFPFSSSTFSLARRLDLAFVSLLRGSAVIASADHQSDSHQISMTDKVRIKSLVEDTRVVAIETAAASGHAAQIQDIFDGETTDTEYTPDDYGHDEQGNDDMTLSISKIYKCTLEILGDTLIQPTPASATNDPPPTPGPPS